MNQTTLNRLINNYQQHVWVTIPDNSVNQSVLRGLVEYGIRNGFLQEVEQQNPYTFGGVTVSLTDTELASVVQFLSEDRKIQAIRVLRMKIADAHLTLKEAKDFADHLDVILKKSRA